MKSNNTKFSPVLSEKGRYMEENNTLIDDKGRKLDSSELVRRGLLVGVSAGVLGTTFILKEGENSLGRDSACSIRIHDRHISGIHCIIRAEDKSLILEDADSSNGTYLNRKKIKKPTPLNYGDRIVAGETIFRLLFEEEL